MGPSDRNIGRSSGSRLVSLTCRIVSSPVRQGTLPHIASLCPGVVGISEALKKDPKKIPPRKRLKNQQLIQGRCE